MKNLVNNDPLRNRPFAANYLGVSPNTLAVWACTGRYDLAMVKNGRCVKYRQSDLDSFIERNVISRGVLQ